MPEFDFGNTTPAKHSSMLKNMIRLLGKKEEGKFGF